MVRFSQLLISPSSNGDDVFVGTSGADWADGAQGDDALSGMAGDDTLFGGEGDDDLSGGDGADTLHGGAGNDTLNGGSGFDIASYEGATSGVRLRLVTAIGQTTGGAGRDMLIGIEGLIGSSFSDVLTGDNNANVLNGGAGNDLIIGGFGNDTLIGGLGDDLIDGGRDGDTADYGDIVADLTVSLAITVKQETGAAGFDRLTNIEHLIGGVGNDRLIGSATDNRIQGGLGNDSLDGGAGGDTLIGEGGNDSYFIDSAVDIITEAADGGSDTVFAAISYILDANVETLVLTELLTATRATGNSSANALRGNSFSNLISGEAGDDTLWGGLGNDTLMGGDGDDVANYADATLGLTLRLDTTAVQSLGLFGDDVLISIEGLVGGSGNDRLTGDENNNRLYGELGRDTLAGGDGADILDGGAGEDSLAGGRDNDLLSGGTGNDTLSGGAGDNTLMGGSGDDIVVYDQSLDDVSVIWLADEAEFWIVTENSTDTVTGVEKFTFGDGVFDASYLQAVRLTLDDDTNTATELGGQIYGLDGNDTIDGAAANDSIDGGAGNDVISGAEGADLLVGGAGNDRIYAGDGNDTVDGGSGNDSLFLEASFDAWNISLVSGGFKIAGTAGVIMASGIEAIYCGTDLTTNRLPLLASLSSTVSQVQEGNSGTATVSFTVTLDRPAVTDLTMEYAVNAVTASINGADFGTLGLLPAGTISVLAGQKTATFTVLISGDTVYEMAETFSVTLKNASSGLIIVQPTVAVAIKNDDVHYLTAADDDFTGTSDADLVEGLFGDDKLSGLAGSDWLAGGAGRDTLYGGADDDTVLGGAGSDILSGDAGIDTVSFEATTTGVDASLAKSLARSAQEGSDRLSGFENLIGGSGNDTLTGDAAANQLSGLAGNDVLDGGDGIDLMQGGAGGDTYYINVAGDSVVEGANQGTDRIISTATYTLSANVEELQLAGVAVINGTGNELDNLMIGNRRNNQLSGAAGSDTLAGDAGNDSLSGDGGADNLTGGSGGDSLFGGLGNDTLNGDQIDGILDGGADKDTLELAGRFTSASDTQLANIEVVTLTKTGLLLSLARQSEGFTVNGFATGASTIIGGAGVDSITGGSGADSLAGGGGADSLIGGLGHDTLIGDQADALFDGGAGNDVLQVAADFTAVSDGQIINVQVVTLVAAGLLLDLSNQSEGLTLNGFATGASTILGCIGADIIIGGSGADNLSGGSGNDILVGTQAATLLDGGADTDVLQISADFAAVSDDQVANLEVVSLAADGLLLNFSNQTEDMALVGFAKGASTIIGGAGVDLIVGGSGADRLTGSGGADSLSGEAGNDTLIGAQADTLLDGGAGTDLLQVAADFVAASNAQLVNVEAVTLTATGLSLDMSNQTEGLILTGFASGASTIVGGSGADSLTGGSGSDILTGGSGVDSFVFSFLTGVDSLSDFTAGSDRILLDRTVLAEIGSIGTLNIDAFWSADNAVTGQDATDRLIYDSASGALYYDADGNGSGIASQIAVLDGQPALNYSDVLVF